MMVLVVKFYTASQMWCLGRMLPFLIGDKIPEEDEHWEHYLLLLSILVLLIIIIFYTVTACTVRCLDEASLLIAVSSMLTVNSTVYR